jgi:hypothetical protein
VIATFSAEPTGVPDGGWSLSVGFQASDLSTTAIWLAYVAIGGDADLLGVEAYLTEALIPGRMQHDILAHALNEHFTDHGMNHPVAYSTDG